MDMNSEFRLSLREMIAAIETAVSQVGIDDTNHGKRVGYIASQLGHELGYSEHDLEYLSELGMLHDIGVSSEQTHNNLMAQFDWDLAYLHCEIGYHLLKDFEPLAHFALPIRYHHTPWIELKEQPIPPRDAMMANLIHLADRIDALGFAHYDSDILAARDTIAETLQSKAGEYFHPDFVEAFIKAQASEAFWIALEDRHIMRYTWDMSNKQNNAVITLSQLKQLSRIMAYIVDQKSEFTALHSAKVAELARFLAEAYGMMPVQCDKIEIAGLLHDLGKLSTPDRILDKPGRLDPAERSIMNQHSYETYEILRHIHGLEEISHLAAYHHEGLNGGGYPFHPQKQNLPVEARIIAAADVFQALVQKRPYREGLPLDSVLEIVDEMRENRKLDPTIVELIHLHKDECFQIASGESSSILLSHLGI